MFQENVHRDVIGSSLGGTLAGNSEPLPCLVTFVDDLSGVLLVLRLTRERELVLGLAIGDLVDTEPLVGSTEEAGEVALDILDVVELGRKGVVHIDDDDLPVGLLLVEQGHNTEDLDLLDLAGVANELTDLADVERVIVTLGLGLGVDGVGVLPGLHRKVRVSLPARHGTGMYSRI